MEFCLTRQINADCQKLRRFALHLLAPGYLQRYKLLRDADDINREKTGYR